MFKFIFTANKLLTLLNCSNLALLGQFQCRATALRKYNDQNQFDFSTAVVGRLKPSRAHTCQLSRIIRESPGYDTNLPVSRTGHHIFQIKSSFEIFCALV